MKLYRLMNKLNKIDDENFVNLKYQWALDYYGLSGWRQFTDGRTMEFILKLDGDILTGCFCSEKIRMDINHPDWKRFTAKNDSTAAQTIFRWLIEAEKANFSYLKVA